MWRVLVLLYSLIYSNGLLANEICPVCPKTTDVAVTFASVPRQSSDVEWELKLKQKTWDFWKKPNQIQNEGIIQIGSLDKIRETMTSLARQCKRIKFLGFYSHGDVGTMAFGKDILDRESLKNVFSGLNCAMSQQATVSIFGCNVGRDCRGQYFLTQFGKLLLAKGGKITAPTDYAQQYPLLPSFSFNLSPEAVTFTVGASPIAKHPYTLSQCLIEEESKVKKFEETMKQCGYFLQAIELARSSTRLKKMNTSLAESGNRMVTQMDELDPIARENFISELEHADMLSTPENRIQFYLQCMRNKISRKQCF